MVRARVEKILYVVVHLECHRYGVVVVGIEQKFQVHCLRLFRSFLVTS